MSSNRFQDIEGIEELIGNAVGAASSPRLWMSERTAVVGDPMSYAEPLPATCDTLGRSCIFQDQIAREIVRETIERLGQIMGGAV